MDRRINTAENIYLNSSPVDAIYYNNTLIWPPSILLQNFFAVGAGYDDDQGTDAGAVYVFDVNDLSATPTKLTPTELGSYDRFGLSVAVSDNHIVVGAYSDDYRGTDAGAVYVFDVNDLSATPTKLTPTELEGGDRFGLSVAVTSNQIVVGAYGDDDQGYTAGAVYVFDATDLSATPTKLTPSGIGTSDNFGRSVAVSDTLIVVGAINDDDQGTDAGAAYVFDATDLSATPTKLTPTELEAADYFGFPVAVSDTHIVFGVYRDDDQGGDAGAVYVFDATDLSATPTKLTPTGIGTGDVFGLSVAVSDTHIVVGAPSDDDQGTNAGAVYVFDVNDLSATPTKLTPTELEGGDQFGASVAVSDTHIVVGAGSDDDQGTNAGAVYVFDATDLSATPTKLTPSGIGTSDRFGNSIGI